MQQQLPRAQRVVVVVAGVGIRSDMRIQQKGFPILDEAVGVLQIGLTLADRLDLGPAQGYARLVLLEDEVVVTGLAILGGVAGAGSHRVAQFGLRRSRFYGMAGGSGHGCSRSFSSYIVTAGTGTAGFEGRRTSRIRED